MKITAEELLSQTVHTATFGRGVWGVLTDIYKGLTTAGGDEWEWIITEHKI